MREIRYTFCTLGTYETEQSTAFAEDTHLSLVVEPHEFSVGIGGEVLRSTSFDGCRVMVSRNGKVTFYSPEGDRIGGAEAASERYAAVRLRWKPDAVCIEFGHTETEDHYPHCDGEYDRWSEVWVIDRLVTLNTGNRTVEVK